MHEWPLLIFTIAMQAAIGGIFVLWIFQMRHRKKEIPEMFNLFKIPLIVIALLSLVGLGASFAHLGAPLNALNTIRNVGSSWMSREILVTGMFIGLVFLTVVWTLYRKKVSSWLLLAAALIGLVDVYCMAAIYSNSLIGPWNSIHTFMSFYGTTLVLGAVLAIVLLIPSLYKQKMELEAKHFFKTAIIFVLSGIGFHVIGVALFPATMAETSIIGSTVATGDLSSYQGMIASRWIISVLGIVLLGYMALSSNKKYFVNLSFIALLIFVLSEGMSRYVFYLMGS